jgi:hypothetical protein
VQPAKEVIPKINGNPATITIHFNKFGSIL